MSTTIKSITFTPYPATHTQSKQTFDFSVFAFIGAVVHCKRALYNVCGSYNQEMTDKLHAIIVDDEENGRQNLQHLLMEHCPEIKVLGLADSAEEARRLVAQLNPDVVFLDIAMPKQNGFDFLDSYDERPFAVVFVTAYNQHALRAIKTSAVDYILKPIDVHELRAAVAKLVDLRETVPATADDPPWASGKHLQILLENLRSGGKFQRIILQRIRGFKVVEVNDIVYIRADSNYASVVLTNGETILATSTLKEFEEMLNSDMFCRIHKSCIVSLLQVNEYNTDSGGFIVLHNKERLQVSVRRAKTFVDKMQAFVNLAR